MTAAALALAACQTTMDGDMGATGASSSSAAAAGVEMGGATMLATNTIAANLALSQDHETLLRAVEAAGLEATLSGSGNFTVFAPTDAAFDRLGAATVNSLLDPAARAQLTNILTYHIIPSRMLEKDIVAAIRAGGGKAMLTTVQGQQLTASLRNGIIMLTDARGQSSYVTTDDAVATNGVVHEVNAVLAPKPGGAAS